jgi:hypothetical protein
MRDELLLFTPLRSPVDYGQDRAATSFGTLFGSLYHASRSAGSEQLRSLWTHAFLGEIVFHLYKGVDQKTAPRQPRPPRDRLRAIRMQEAKGLLLCSGLSPKRYVESVRSRGI